MLDTPPPPVKETVPGAEREAANVIEMDPLVILERQLEALDRPHQVLTRAIKSMFKHRVVCISTFRLLKSTRLDAEASFPFPALDLSLCACLSPEDQARAAGG